MVTETSTMTPVPKAPARYARHALLASLAINLLFVGGLVSAFVRHGGRPGGGPAAANLGAYVSTLPKERGEVIWKRTRDLRTALGPLRRELRQARDEALDALTAEPFEKERFVAAQTRLIDLEHRQRLGQRDVLAEVAGSMTPDERRGYLRWRGPPRQLPGNDPDEPPSPKR